MIWLILGTATHSVLENSKEEETEFKDRESLKLSLFTVYYPKAWNYDKENMKKDEEYSHVRFFDGDTADGSENVISIEATKEDSYTYRKSLIAFGVDLEAYAEGKMDTVTIGNAEFSQQAKKVTGANIYEVSIPEEYQKIDVIAVTNYELSKAVVQEEAVLALVVPHAGHVQPPGRDRGTGGGPVAGVQNGPDVLGCTFALGGIDHRSGHGPGHIVEKAIGADP